MLDGDGVVILNDKKKYEYIKKLANHGLIDRKLCETLGYVSRMDAYPSCNIKREN